MKMLKKILLVIVLIIGICGIKIYINYSNIILSDLNILENKNNSINIHANKGEWFNEKNGYIILSGTTYINKYKLPQQLWIFGSLEDPIIAFSGLNIASTLDGYLLYDNIKIKLPQGLIGRGYFEPDYMKIYTGTINKNLVLSDNFFPNDASISKNEKKIVISISKSEYLTKNHKSEFCNEENNKEGIGADKANVFSKEINTIQSVPICIIYREYERSENTLLEKSLNSMQFFLEETNIQYQISLYNYNKDISKDIFNSFKFIN